MSFKYLIILIFCLIISFTSNLRAQALLGILPQGDPTIAFEAFIKNGFTDAYPDYPETKGKVLKGYVLGQKAIIKIFSYNNEIESFELSYPDFGSGESMNWYENKRRFFGLRENLTHKYQSPTSETWNDNGLQINTLRRYELKEGTIFHSYWNLNDKYDIQLIANPGIYLTYSNKTVVKKRKDKESSPF